MFILIMIIHVFVCIVLISVILLQSGRGGGLSEMLGGGMQQQQKLFGTQTNTFLTKATSYCAVAFLITSISLGFLTSRKSRSLIEDAPEIKPFFDHSTSATANNSEQVDAVKKAIEDIQSKAQATTDEVEEKIATDDLSIDKADLDLKTE